MKKFKSIWDGWEKQCFGRQREGDGNCAIGYLNAAYLTKKRMQPRVRRIVQRVGVYIANHYRLPERVLHEQDHCYYYPSRGGVDALVYANNVLRFTPERFREMDRLSWEAEQG